MSRSPRDKQNSSADAELSEPEIQNNVIEAEIVENLSVAEPAIVSSPEVAQPMAVEKQEKLHNEVHNAYQALQPGRVFVAGDGLLGEISDLIHKSELAGNTALSGELQAIELKVGELVTYLAGLENNAAKDARPLYAKLISFFRK